MPDKPWVMRTYAGHSSAKESNALYRRNLAKGQTGLSVAFDLPTQTGYDPDHELSRGEVGKVGVPIPHLGAMRQLFKDIPLDTMNTSMTINATAMWLLAMYEVAAEEQGIDPSLLSGTTQNDIIKEYLSRGTYVFGPAPSLRLTTDMIAYTVSTIPKWNPLNICSYHLQEAGATPTQELAYALTTAIVCWTPCATPARSRPMSSRRSSAASRSSSTPASGSSKRCARCAPSAGSGKRSPVSVTA
ncbi:MAG: methylmalonyl-CoA mutase family protein [Aeromicrobium sp.]